MRRIFQVSALLLGLTGCSLTIDADGVPPPVPGNCTPVCNASLVCGVTLNNCNTTCAVGSGCTPPTTTGLRVDRGGLTLGAAHASGASHQVQGQLGLGSTAQDLQGLTFQVQQGTLR